MKAEPFQPQHHDKDSLLPDPSFCLLNETELEDGTGIVIPINRSRPLLQTEPVLTQLNTCLPVRIKDRYLIEKELGRGGIGIVYLARDEELHGKRVVIKLLLDAHPSTENGRWYKKKFRQELEAMARISHPGIVDVLDAGELSSGQPYIVMEYIEGTSLRSVMRNGEINLARAANFLKQIGQALSAAHDKGVHHRDLKPENIMIQDLGNGEEQARLIDFGIATVKDSRAISEGESTQVAGTLPYMAPEQLRGHPSALSDVFALGVIGYEMLMGRVPFQAKTHLEQHELQQTGSPVRPAESRHDLPHAAEQAILKALAFNPADRQQRARDFGEEFWQAVFANRIEASSDPVNDPYKTKIKQVVPPDAHPFAKGMRVVLLYKRNAEPDEQILRMLEMQLSAQGCRIFIDRNLAVGVQWAREIERELREAEVVIPLLSAASVNSEMLAQEVRIAHDSAREYGRPILLPVRINFTDPLPEPLGALLNPIQHTLWTGPQDDKLLAAEMLNSVLSASQVRPAMSKPKLEPVGGAVPLDSEFYIVRPTDAEFQAAIARQDSIVLVKGARQMGKTSLLARGLGQAREQGARVVLTDFQMLDAAQLASVDALFQAFGETIAEQLDLDTTPAEHWNPRSGANVNFARFLRREILGRIEAHLVWGLDEVDRLYSCEFGSQVFALFRSWHNARALDPTAPWHRLTLAIAYATEAHLFITDINQSPFNVGTRLTLDDFTPEQVAELNHRHGHPLCSGKEEDCFYQLTGGQPYLVRRGLHQMTSQGLSLEAFAEQSDHDEGPLGDHLRRLLFVLAQNQQLCDSVREVLQGRQCPTAESFYRLRSAGVMAGDSASDARLRCKLYTNYLKRHLL